MSSLPDPTPPQGETSLHVRRALAGESRSVEWIVDHFSPLLLAQARYRLSRALQGRYDPEDLVQDVWAVCLPKLGAIEAREGRFTPVLLRYLGTTLLRTHHHLVEKHLAGKPGTVGLGSEGGDGARAGPAGLEAPVTGAVTRARKSEARDRVAAVIDALPDHHREILILRGLEEMPYRLAARKLGVDEPTLRARFRRAALALKDCLPADVVDELLED